GAGPGTWMTAQSLVPASIIQGGLMTDLRAFLMPSFLHSFKLAGERGIRTRPLLVLITAVVLITFGMSLWMNVKLGYEHGGLTLESWFAQGGAKKPASDAAALMGSLRDVSTWNVAWMGVGMLITAGMVMARA